MTNSYPYVEMEQVQPLFNALADMHEISSDVRSMLVAIEAEADGDNRPELIMAMARSTQSRLNGLEDASEQVREFWREALGASRAYKEVAARIADMPDTDEGRAVRELSRDMAGMIAKITRPAFKAITEMQNQAAEIDAMVQRARDMAGCLGWLHSPDRDPERPEFNSLAHTVGEAMDPRTIAFAAAVHRARARQDAATDAA